MDAIKLLKGLMGNKSLSSSLGSKLLGGMLGGGSQQQSSSPLAGILSGMLGGGQRSSGGGLMSGLIGSMLGGGNSGSGSSGIAGIVGGMLGGGQETEQAPEPESELSHHDQAVLMIRAMVNAAKSDGRIDESEQENIISKLGEEVSEGEIEFLRKEFAAPLDASAYAKTVPSGMEQQIYAISLTSIELDTQNEANYLGELAQGLNLEPDVCNQIHDHLGAPKIFG